VDKYNEETSKVRTTIDAYLNIKSPYERVRITMMIKRLSHDYVIKCSACHDDYANGVIGPSLLGKDADFIYKRIMAFKTGEKKNILMKELISKIDNKKLKSLAEEIANFNKEILKMRMGK
jgi:cytochrome c553